MISFKTVISIATISICAALPLSSIAQTVSGKMEAPAQTAAMTDGEVRKVDQENGKVTIKHGDIKHLDMPGMTMVFTAKDKGLLANVKAGEKVKFMVINEGGKMVVTDIQSVK